MDSSTSNAAVADPGAMLDTSSQEAPIITLWVIMTTLAAVTVCMRFYTRRLILRILGPEDWLIVAAMVLAIGACVGFIRRECRQPPATLVLPRPESDPSSHVETQFGLGHHIWTLTPDKSKQWGIVSSLHMLPNHHACGSALHAHDVVVPGADNPTPCRNNSTASSSTP